MEAKTFNQIMLERGLTIVCAESITAGLLASTIASVSGASKILDGSIVTYNAKLKIAILGVNEKTLADYSAESSQTTEEMVKGLRELWPNAKVHVAVTGLASNPVDSDYPYIAEIGQVFVCISYEGKFKSYTTIIKPGSSGDERNFIRNQAVNFIFDSVVEVTG